MLNLRNRWGGVCTSLGLPDALRHQLEAQSNEMLRQLEPEDERYLEIPPEYGAAWPLDLDEQTTRNIAGSFGYPSVMYKVIDRRSGKPYTLRRVDGARNSPKVNCVLWPFQYLKTNRQRLQPRCGGVRCDMRILCLSSAHLYILEQHISFMIILQVRKLYWNLTSLPA